MRIVIAATLGLLAAVAVAPAVVADVTAVFDPPSAPANATVTFAIQDTARCNPANDPAFELYLASPGRTTITVPALIPVALSGRRDDPDTGMALATARVPRVAPGVYGFYWRCPTTGATTGGGSELFGVDETLGHPAPGPYTFRVLEAPAASTEPVQSGRTTGGAPRGLLVLVAVVMAVAMIWRRARRRASTRS